VDQATQQFNQLMQRPRHRPSHRPATSQMYLQVRQRLSSLLPTLTWSQIAGCDGVPRVVPSSPPWTPAGPKTMPSPGVWATGISTGPSPDAQWTNALAAHRRRRAGLRVSTHRPEVIVSKPGNHNANFYGQLSRETHRGRRQHGRSLPKHRLPSHGRGKENGAIQPRYRRTESLLGKIGLPRSCSDSHPAKGRGNWIGDLDDATSTAVLT